ncbi:MAG: hypothetical protein ACREGF_00390 [Candidatus Saccharimonadales bacterium]
MGEQSPQPKDPVIKLASRFHDDWRATRKQEDGSYEPRIKTTKDETWAAQHGTTEVDIANTSFEDLPEDWQAENKTAAEVAQGALEAGIASGADITRDTFVESASSQIHDAWLGRNEWAKGGELDVPYAQLTPDEQDKDSAQILTAIELQAQ